MSEKTTTDDTPAVETDIDPHQGSEFTSWEFFEQPTAGDVVDKLKTLPEWFGLRPETYVEFIQPLSQSKNFGTGTRKDYRMVWTLYVTVAGRIAMIRDAAKINDWTVDFEPEPHTPTGIPGMLQFDGDRIVYREYCVIQEAEGRLLGRKPGTAWVPATGGGGAVASNRFEKVETSARGRSIAAWGFGILPGSGVASLDEMLSLTEMRQAVGQERQRQQQGGERKTRPELESELRMRIVEYQQESGSTDEEMDARVKKYVKASFGRDLDKNADGSWNFEILKDGEIVLFRNRMLGETQKIRNEKGLYAMLQIDDKTGAVTFGDRIVGEYDTEKDVLTLNMGWCRLAGLGVVVEGDKDDRRRVLLDRSEGGKAPEAAVRKPRKTKEQAEPDPDQMALDESQDGTPPPSSDDPWAKDPVEDEQEQPGPRAVPQPVMDF